MLGGFVIRRFMTTWTLVIKCVGLVSQICVDNPRIFCLQMFSASQLHQDYGLGKKAL